MERYPDCGEALLDTFALEAHRERCTGQSTARKP